MDRHRGVRPPCAWKLHLSDFDAVVRADLNAAHATDALPCLIRVGLAVRTEPIHFYRTDVYAFPAAGATLKIDIHQIHYSFPPFLELYTATHQPRYRYSFLHSYYSSTGVTTAMTTSRLSPALNP
jgi:hypothetical protein